MRNPWNFLFFGMALLPAFEAGAADTPEELGKVEWLRDYGEAQAKAKESGKPILILFQEVPG